MRRDGNWEGRNVLRRVTRSATRRAKRSSPRAARDCSPTREARAGPPRDDKVLADWNGLMIAALARAAAVFDGARVSGRGPRGLRLRLARILRDAERRPAPFLARGRVGAPGMLDDYAALARAALALFEATGAPDYLERADAAPCAAGTARPS